jgi:hypothetical protein
MNIDLDIRFIGRKAIEVDYGDRKDKEYADKILCFKHAVMAAIRNEDIRIEIDDFSSDNDFRPRICEDCYET